MGVSFSHCDFGLTYGLFNQIRKDLAREAGIPLGRMQGYGGAGPWDEITDPLVPFLRAPDTDGSLTPEQCLACKRRIQELASRWSPSSKKSPHVRKDLVMRLAEGMALAAYLGEMFDWY